jgi:hypothetical protein
MRLQKTFPFSARTNPRIMFSRYTPSTARIFQKLLKSLPDPRILNHLASTLLRTMSSNEFSLDSIAVELAAITQSIDSLDKTSQNDAELALGRLFRAVQKFNYLSQTQLGQSMKPLDSSVQSAPAGDIGILNDFDTWVQKFKEALAQVAKVLAASQYTIGVQFPFAISVSVTFVP